MAFAVAAVCSLGATLTVGGDRTGVPLPWELIDSAPIFRYAIPIRLSVFAFLAASVIVALWLAHRGGVARWALVALALLCLIPSLETHRWKTAIADPAFFSSHQYRRYLRPGDRVLSVPIAGANMRWQARAGFEFSYVGGYLGAPPESYTSYPIWWPLAIGGPGDEYADPLYRFVHDKGVTAIVVDRKRRASWRELFATLADRPVETGGVLLYRLGPSGKPAAPYRPPGTTFTLAGSTIRSSAGSSFRIVPGRITGRVDATRPAGADAELTGWAGDPTTGHPAQICRGVQRHALRRRGTPIPEPPRRG